MTRSHCSMALALAGLLVSIPLPGFAEPATAPVKVTGGDIVGTDRDGMRTYLGVPFAAPPVGNLRWRPPQPVLPWTGVHSAQAFSAACAQTPTWISNPKSEDCLYLNVWAPDGAAKLPVIVWIHGGALEGGSAAVPVFDGAHLARRGAIVVTLNYRLGIFGFYASPELSAESPGHVSGNQGILDQIAALRWVKTNIAAFGGDPDRVTIMGNSSGSESVAVLVASPLAKGLFQRAVGESGNDAMPISPEDDHRFDHKAAAEAKGTAFAKAAGATRLADLRKLSVKDLQRLDWSPRVYVDGYVLHADLTTIYRRHQQNDVPILVGWNAEEGKDLVQDYLDTPLTAAAHTDQMTQVLGYAPSARLLAIYPGATDAEAATSIKQLVNDWWGFRMVHWAALQARYGRSKSYVYYFAHRPAPTPYPCHYGCGAGHGAEQQYILDNLDVDKGRPWSVDDRQLANRMADTVVEFARTGQPSGGGLPAWPAFDGANTSIMPIGNATELQAHPMPDFSVFSHLGDETQ